METELLDLRNGRITFDRFVQLTQHEWEALAGRLYHRWTPPTGYSVEDTVQDLLLAAWPLVGTWDPERGVTISKYVIWNACSKAKRVLHKARGAKLSGTADKNPTRGETHWIDTPRESSEEMDLSLFDRLQIVKELASHLGEVDTCILERLAIYESAQIVASEIYGNPKTRIALRLGNETRAITRVKKTISTATRIAVERRHNRL